MKTKNLGKLLLKRLEKLKHKKSILREKYNGNEEKYTFHAGYDLGYIEGKIAMLEIILDEIEDN